MPGVHGKSATRYMGFKPSYKREAPTMKCGETLSGRANKFSCDGGAPGSPAQSGRWTSTSSASMGAVSVSDYEAALASNASAKQQRAQRPAPRAFMGETTQEAAFGDARGRAVASTTRAVPSFLLVANEDRVLVRSTPPTTTSGAVSEARRTAAPPGYGGFIPESRNNRLASSQSAYVEPRASREGASLAARYSHEVSGYTGHQPLTIANSNGPRGASLLTTSGSSSRWLVK